MTLAIVAVGLALMAFPGLAAHRAWCRPPAEWSRVAGVSIAVGAVTLYIGLVLIALPTLLRFAEVEGIASMCQHVLDRLTIGGPLFGWAATGLVAIATTRAFLASLRARRSSRSARIEPWLGEHFDQGEFELVVLATPALIAVGVPGIQPQVVISEGLLSELDEPRLEAVISHEAAHHRLGHRRYLLLAALVDRVYGVLPPVRRSTSTLRDAIEQWADEAAARGAPERASTLGAAIVSVGRAVYAGGGESLPGPLETRARRLEQSAPATALVARGLTYMPVGALGFTAVFLVSGWFLASHHAFALGGYCPT